MFVPFLLIHCLLAFFCTRGLGFLIQGPFENEMGRKSKSSVLASKRISKTAHQANGNFGFSSSNSSSSNSSSSSSSGSSDRHLSTLPSTEWQNVHSVTGFLGPKCIPMSANDYEGILLLYIKIIGLHVGLYKTF